MEKEIRRKRKIKEYKGIEIVIWGVIKNKELIDSES
jgi:hypothetical protein